MSGTAGQDRIFGGAGNDVLDGGTDDDFVMGDSAGNRVRYTETELGGDIYTYILLDHIDEKDQDLSYEDTINGGLGNDTLIGEIGNDSISGGAGDDWIEGDKLNDSSQYGGDEGQYSSYINSEGV